MTWNRYGGSPKTAIEPLSLFTSDITHVVDTVTGVRDPSLSVPDNQSYLEQQRVMRSLSGESSSMTAAKRESIARSFVTNLRTFQASLSDRLTQSLITHGLVKGITPTSIRQMSGQPIRAFAFDAPDGRAADEPKADCSSTNETDAPSVRPQEPASGET